MIKTFIFGHKNATTEIKIRTKQLEDAYQILFLIVSDSTQWSLIIKQK